MGDFVGVEMTSVDIHHIEQHRNDKPILLFLKQQGLLFGEFLFSVQW